MPAYRLDWAIIHRDAGRILLVSEGLCVLLGVESRTLPRYFPTPFGDVRLVIVKALLPAELEHMLKRGAQGPPELARRFAQTAGDHVSWTDRKAVVE